ncbi:FMN-binding protein [Patescibacteria group bacterium]|nr:FMN-binding protein [Patescibacteria group bacterium]
MRKYLQITVVLGVFGLVVLVRHLNPENHKIVISPPNTVQNIITASPTSLPTATATLTPSPSARAPGSNVPVTQPPATPTPTTAPTPTPSGQYKDGTYTGATADAFYGYMQVQAVISGGRLTDVVFLQYPNDNGTSQYINSQAMPYLKQEALAAQSANVNIISGASDSSMAFQQSLASALAQAK